MDPEAAPTDPEQPPVPPGPSSGAALRRYVAALDARDWHDLAACLAPGFEALLVHTGERFDADAQVAFNRDYPGAWRVTLQDVVADGDRAAGRARVSDGGSTFHVALFATVAAGALVELVEVWTEAEQPPPDRST
ncbi:nuclear transport factor 2 family protein [Nocardioides sp. 1609]|uniref:nuclear transport factor 2 family protein n=1 Tax=Nocardioides sp. 1609 TaxID=2508327 RepID=UPI0010704962|nr:nuclear transport factor 2 family protein [Nocardioides sp. 1609]